MDLSRRISELLIKVKSVNPLVHHITNYVTANDCANITLALGASPVMTDYIEEVGDVVSLASALVLNLGTLSGERLQAMLKAGKRANELSIPVVLDPVGVGSSVFRARAALDILKEIKLCAIRGNFSEIKTLCGIEGRAKGVDSAEIIGQHFENEKKIIMDTSKELHTVIAVTGAFDVVTDGISLCKIMNGHEIMSRVTGTGCMCTSLIGSCLGTKEDPFIAVTAGIAYMGIAGENAWKLLIKNEEGTGSFKTRILDSVYNLNKDKIANCIKIKHNCI